MAPAIVLSAVHVGALAVAGACLLALARVTLPPAWADRLALSYVAGWGTLPLVVLVACAVGSLGWAVVLTLVGLAAAARWRRRRGEAAPATPDGAPEAIPLGAYVLALGYTVVSVAVPFSRFAAGSIVRELFIDGVQRFGTAYALAQSVPPANPFVAGAPLQYYWFFLVPVAAEYRAVHADLFAVWKCANTWTPVLLLPALWWVVRAAFRSRAAAWAALAFGFVFASWEIFASRFLLDALRAGVSGWRPLAAGLASEVLTSDPDMRVGLVTTYSDQLFMEDFVYVPQNAAALMVVLLALWLSGARRTGVSAFVLSSLAGVNTFFAIPAYAAFTLAHVPRAGVRRAAILALALGAWSLVWLRICGILDTPLALTVASGGLGLALLPFTGTPREADVDLRTAAWALLISLALVVSVRPVHHAAALVLNYGPALLLGVLFAVRSVQRRVSLPPGASWAVLVLLLAASVSALASFTLMLPFTGLAPPELARPLRAAGDVVNLFNFHHKTWKLTRLGLAILAGLLLAQAAAGWRARLAAHPAWRAWVLALLAAATLTGLVRPFTYLGPGPVAEQAAAEYLRAHGRGIATTVLLENFRASRVPMLAPVSAYYFSTWSGGNPGLTHAVGTWADQYLPARARPESARREALVQRFFAGSASREERARIVRDERIDFIVTATPYALAPLATLVAGTAGGYLYRVEGGPGR